VRIALVFARRGYNIESLVVSADVANGEFSRMTITCSGDPETLEQIIKQVTKLIDVVTPSTTPASRLRDRGRAGEDQVQAGRPDGDPADRGAVQRQGRRLRRRFADRAHRRRAEKIDVFLSLLRNYRSSSWCARARS
jgi:acetolactate synthase regulatory subunit